MRNYPKSDKVASLPVPGAVWTELSPTAQMGFVMQECGKFIASPYFAGFGGFRIVVVHDAPNGEYEYEVVLCIGADPIDAQGQRGRLPLGVRTNIVGLNGRPLKQ